VSISFHIGASVLERLAQKKTPESDYFPGPIREVEKKF